MPDTPAPPEPRYARAGSPIYATLVGLLVSLLLISNVSASKPILFGPFPVDGGVFLFPLVYVVGDVLSEVYGLKATRLAIILGFAMSGLAAVTFWVVIWAPPLPEWGSQEAFAAVLGYVPRIVIASMLGYLVGQLLNSYVLVRMKRRSSEGRLWARLIGSTAVGELADTVIFCTIAFAGVMSGQTLLLYIAVGYVYKTLLEVVLLPITYPVIAAIKKREPSYRLAA
jgi:uncharacterized integral membrane protein (TIGR00697 family)